MKDGKKFYLSDVSFSKTIICILTEYVGSVDSRSPENFLAAWMLRYKRGYVVDLALDNSPAIELRVMLCDLLYGVVCSVFEFGLQMLIVELREKLFFLFFFTFAERG